MASRLLVLLSRTGTLPKLRVPTLAVGAWTAAPHQRRLLRLSATRHSATSDWDHIEPLASACEKYAGHLDTEGYVSDIGPAPGSAALNAGNTAMRAETEDILANALHINPPATPGALLERIAEGRAIASSSYVKAIIGCIQVHDSSSLDAQSEVVFKPHMLNEEVCTQLMLAIHQSSSSRVDHRVDSRVLVALYNVSRSRGWDISPTILEHVAVYLANNSLNGVSEGIRHVSYWTRIHIANGDADVPHFSHHKFLELETSEVSLSTLWQQARVVLAPKHMRALETYLQDDPLDTVMDISRLLSDKKYKSNPAFDACVMRALYARERLLDAEWLFARSQDRLDWRYFGLECSMMMSLYYRVRDCNAAEAVFDRFRDTWKQHWNSISSNMVMPDETSLRAENWRQLHEEYAEPHQMLHVESLRKLRRRAAGPFY
ncbi:hypothetical protein H4S07_004177, partial [Coemansia furcata]